MDLNKDYYSILGVSKKATIEEIKKAYRKLAQEHHPDVSGKESSEKFVEISEAYDILKDENKRKEYDSYRNHGFHGNSFGGGGGSGFHRNPFGGFGAGIDDIESFFRANEFANNFRSSRMRVNPDEHATLEITLDQVMHGAEFLYQYKKSKNKNKSYKIMIPPGVQDGQVIRIANKAPVVYPNSTPGDILITIKIANHERFERLDNDLAAWCDISLKKSITGGVEKFILLDGTVVSVKIDKNTKPGTVLRLKGKGLPDLKNPSKRGDTLLKIDVHIPTFDDDQIEKLKEILPDD